MNKSIDSLHGKVVGQGDFQYRINAHWGQLDPEKVPVENCHDFAIDKAGNVYMVTDHSKNNVLVYSPDGELIDAWGTEFPGVHAIEIVQEGDEEFIFLVDSGWKLNPHWDGVSTDDWDSPFNKVVPQAGFIAKLSMDGRIQFTISHPMTIGEYTPDMPFNPTDIAVADNGDLYITDGYGSDYVLHYNRYGQFIRRWGAKDHMNPAGNLQNAHGIAIDKRVDGKQTLVVSSRAEQCLKVYTLEGEFLHTINTPGAWIHGPVFFGRHFISAVCWSHIDGANKDGSGFLAIFDENNRVVSTIGAEPAEYIDGQLQPLVTNWEVFEHAHGVVVDDAGDVYVGQWRAGGAYPYKLERIN